MARKTAPNTSSLSAEYVVDSSDGEPELDLKPARSEQLDVAKTLRSSKSRDEIVKSKKRKRPLTLEKQPSPSPEPEADEASGEENKGVGGLLAESANEETPEPAVIDAVKNKNKAKQRPLAIPTKPFVPPKGFTVVKDLAEDNPGASIVTGDLAGKQIWHITVPASVDMSTIKKLSLDAIESGRPVLTTNGKQYSLLHGFTGSKSILIPSNEEDAYIPLRKTFTHTYHLGEVLNPPIAKDAESGKVQFQAQPAENENEICSGVLKRSKTPAQPDGLKMRYQPFGIEPLSSKALGKATLRDRGSDAELTTLPEAPAVAGERHAETAKLKKKKKKQISEHAATNGKTDDTERRQYIANELSQTLPDLTSDSSKPAGVTATIDAESAKKKKKHKSKIEP